MSSRNQRINSVPEKSYLQDESLGVSQNFARRDHTHGTTGVPDAIMVSGGVKVSPILTVMPDGSYGIDWEVTA